MPADVTCQSIPEALFRDNSIVTVQFNCWTGVATVREGDEGIFGARNFDATFFKRGGVILCNREMLKMFQNRQERLSAYLDGIGGEKFPLINGRVFKNQSLPTVMSAIRECEADIETMKSVFMDAFPRERNDRIRQFNEAHPESAGRLDAYYDALGDVASKFGVQYAMFRIADVSAHLQIIEDEKNALRVHCRNFMEQAAANFRKSVVEAAIAFRRGIEKASGPDGSGVVHTRSVKSFRSFLDRIQNHDLLDDKKMREMIDSMRSKVFNIEGWDVQSDKEAMDAVKAHLDEIVSVGSKEGEASAVVREYSIGAGLSDSIVLEAEPAGSSIDIPTSGDDTLQIVDPEASEVLTIE
jgi:hypothetical protein